MSQGFTGRWVRAALLSLSTLWFINGASAQTVVDLTAMRMSTTLPDGSVVKMWGYCLNSACSKQGGVWAPGPTIVVPTDASGFGNLQINLTNALPTNTSIVILGQLGGGLGAGGTTANDVPRVASPTHNGQPAVTWPAVDPSVSFTPPKQGDRARAFGLEALPGATASTAYKWPKLRPGTYLYETGSTPSLQAPMGLYGVLVVTQAPTPSAAGLAYPSPTSSSSAAAATPQVAYDADVSLLFSEIDPRQNAAVDAAAVAGADVTKLFSDGSCTPSKPCYPPAVNYAPTYFLINGQAFNPTAPSASGFALSDNVALAGGGQMLVRLVNAGLRTHVPSLVGLPVPMNLVAEDGFLLPGRPKAQTHVLMPAGKTFDVTIAPTRAGSTYTPTAFAVFDRALSLTSSNIQDQTAVANSGMIGFIAVQPKGSTIGGNGAAVPKAMQARAINDAFAAPVSGSINGNVLQNDVNVTTAAVLAQPKYGTVVLNSDGSFVYTNTSAPPAGASDTFTYYGNGDKSIWATVAIAIGGAKGGPTAVPDTGAAAFVSPIAGLFKASAPGVLGNDTDPGNLALTAVFDKLGSSDPKSTSSACSAVNLTADGAFTAVPTAPGTSCTFSYHVKNSLGQASAPVDATVNFSAGSGLAVSVRDTQDATLAPIADYSWVIEEDTTFFHDPADPVGANSPNGTLATNFHKSYMPVVASGCTGAASCGTNASNGVPFVQRTFTSPKDVLLDPNKRYYISILPGDADQGNATYNTDGTTTVNAFGHTMGGVSIPSGWTASPAPVTVLVPRNPLPPAQLSVYVFEDNNPTNGAVDANEPGLGGFTINLFDTRGSSGDPAGQMTYDVSGMPFTNSLANRLDSITKVNLCPLTSPSGTIITCPEKSGDGTASPLAGMALVKNIIPGRYDVWATPGADRAARGEHWIQVSTLEGTPANDTFVKPGEKSYWQEFGPPGFHSFIGFVNPDHVAAVNKTLAGTSTVTGRVPSLHMDRPTPLMANLNNSCATGTNADGSPVNPNDASCRAALSSTTCYVALNAGGGTGANVSMATCDTYGNFTLKNVPVGSYSLVIWDQWLDQIIAYKAVTVGTAGQAVVVGDVPVFTWFTRIEQSAFIDLDLNGVRSGNEPGVSQIPMNVRFRDGSIASFLTTDSSGSVTANQLFPLFNWYVVESDTTRYAGTGVHTVYDSGGKPDAGAIKVLDLKGNWIAKDFSGVLNSTESVSLPTAKQVLNAAYTPNRTSRIDPGTTLTEGTQGFINQTAVIDWGKRPYAVGETGGITGLVYYASTRGFDDPSLEVQFSWEPAVPRVPVNLYQVVSNADGSQSRILVDQTTTWSWDDAAGALHCPGDPLTDPFVAVTTKDQFKCYDGQHNFNQIQPTVYDGRYRFPTANCKICQPNPANSLANKPASVTYPAVLPQGKYVVEMVVPQGYEIVKEEDKNILIGDSWIAPAETTQFAGFGNIFILPDQATLNDANVIGSNLKLRFPPCVGALHRVPDYLSLFPDNQQLSPYAGQDRALCDHKLVTLSDQTQANADFQVFTQTPIAGHISGIMLNDAAAEFDPTSPAFLEKASLPNAPLSVRDYNGIEIARVYNDKWGTFNNLVPSTWEANVPNPSGYAPNMLTFCMNDPGPIADPSGAIDPMTKKVRMIQDPRYNPMFSNFCYVWPSMPGITTYLDTPVLPVSAYASASSYEPVDCNYPDHTPAIYRVDGTEVGPFVDLASATRTLTITALGDVQVNNPAYEGPQASAPAVAMQPKVTRHYGFGATPGKVTIGGTAVPVTAWADGSIVVTVPTSGVSSGELAITTADGTQSIDTVTVTIAPVNKPKGYRPPTHVSAPAAGISGAADLLHPIQDAIDASQVGDLIIVDAGNYSELVVMDHPVRLQGVGASAVVINAAKYPNQKIDAWRTRINKAFGLDNQGNTLPGTPAVDPLPGQEITGGILLLEPSVLATEEGAGITVVAKGYRVDGVTPLGSNRSDCGFKGNFLCGDSRIDGLSVTGGDSGGGIYVNGWAHNLEVSNNRVFGNAGSLNGGIRIGQPYLEGQTLPPGRFDGFAYDSNVRIHHNAVTNNGTVEGNAAAGALAAATGGAGGGVSICAGSDGYQLTGNWICGNYSSSDGGGVGHIGLSMDGLIQGNKIIFNESYGQTTTQNGGGLAIEGEGATGTTLTLGTGNVTVDRNLILGNFARAGSGGGLRLDRVNGSDAAGGANRAWKVSVTNNMITNNLAAYAGAGISLADTLFSTVVNNTVVANDSTGIAGVLFNTNVTGSGGGATSTGATTTVPNPAGVSSELTSAALLASLPRQTNPATYKISDPHLSNNIVWHNRSFFFTIVNGTTQLSPSNNWTDAIAPTKPGPLGAPGPDGCVPGQEKYWDLGVVGDTTLPTAPPPPTPLTFNVQGASQTFFRVVNVTTSTALNLPNFSMVQVTIAGVTGNSSAGYDGTFTALVTGPRTLSYSPAGGGTGNFGGLSFAGATVSYTPAATQAPGAIPVGNTILSTSASPLLKKVYCNASRTLPGLQFEPGTPFQPAFNISASATLDESGNFVDLHFGPLSLMDPTTGKIVNGDYHLAGAAGSAYNVGVTSGAPATDYDGQGRPQSRSSGTGVDVGADEYLPSPAAATVAPAALTFASQSTNTTSATQTVTVTNTAATGSANLVVSQVAASSQFVVMANTCATLAPGASCTFTVAFRPTSGGAVTGSVTVTDNAGGVTNATQTVALAGTGVANFGKAAVSPTAVSFGAVKRGTTSQTQSVTLSNTGPAALTIASIRVPVIFGGNPFVVSNGCPQVLAPNSQPCVVTVVFKPTASTGNAATTLTITDNSDGVNGSTQTVSLTGTGTQ